MIVLLSWLTEAALRHHDRQIATSADVAMKSGFPLAGKVAFL